MAQRGALNNAQSGIGVGDYNSALIRLGEAESYKKPDPAVEAQIVYLRGVCYDGIGSHNEAKALYKFTADHYPDTQYGYMAQAKLTNNDTTITDDTFMSVTGPAIFAAYDSRLVKSITNSWFSLLKPVEPKAKRGIIVLRFSLHSDGSVTDVKVTRNTTASSLESVCEKAVLDPAPYEHWMPEMLASEGKTYRTITFTFNYVP
jgi:hypothetical protein